MNLIYICGAWDMLHLGHINLLQRAKALGGTLIVGVCPDEILKEEKKELPFYCLGDRIKMLEALKCVDAAIPYNRDKFVINLDRMGVDVLVVGEDWGFRDRHLKTLEYMKSNNKKVIQFPYTRNISTTEIKNKLRKIDGQ